MADNSKTIRDRQIATKEEILKIAEEISIDSQICKKVGLGRSTFYRWLKDDEVFAKKFVEATRMGVSYICDRAEINIIKKLLEGDLKASMFWLKHHREDYVSKWDIHGHFKMDHELNEFEVFNRKLYPKSQL